MWAWPIWYFAREKLSLECYMAWNEPGGGKKDPWGSSGGDQGPPDLDEVVRKLQEKLGGIFGGGRGSGRAGGGGGKGSPAGTLGIAVIVGIALVIWLLTGIYIVDEGKQGVVLRLGRYVESTPPGPHWHIPYPFESVQIVDVAQQRFVEVGYRSGGVRQAQGSVPREALMLTEDENIVNVQIAVQYRVKNARDYLFNVRSPDETLKQATESAIRETVGKSRMDFVLTQGRTEIVVAAREVLQEILDQYQTGLVVLGVNMQAARPPQEVKAAFDDAIKAREDEQRLKNEAEAYAFEILPKARGAAARILEESNAYKSRVIAQAEGEASRFLQLYNEYAKAPEVTRERLYLEAIESVLRHTNKVMVDVEGGNNLLYLPLDRLVPPEGRGRSGSMAGSEPRSSGQISLEQQEQDARLREGGRGRRSR